MGNFRKNGPKVWHGGQIAISYHFIKQKLPGAFYSEVTRKEMVILWQ